MKIQKFRNGIALLNKLDYINEKINNIVDKKTKSVFNQDERISNEDYEEINQRLLEVIKTELYSIRYEVEVEIENL